MPHLVCVGLSYKTAIVNLREAATLSTAQQKELLNRVGMGTLTSIDELVIVSTCNRTEFYAVGDLTSTVESLFTLWAEISGMSDSALRLAAYRYTENDCVIHLLEVAAGLDSQVIGEPQILGQVIDAYEQAGQCNATGPTLSTLMQHAIQAGKRVRHETDLSRGSLSIGSVAALHSNEVLGSLASATVLIVGAGEMARTAAAAFIRRGTDRFLITNHNMQHAQEFAEQWGGQVVPFTQLSTALIETDLVITAVAAPHPILRVDDLQTILPTRSARPLIIFDVALPRNVEPEVGNLPGVRLYNLDDLQAVSDAHYNLRQEAVPNAKAIITEQATAFAKWQVSRAAVPVIQNLRAKAETIRQAELDHLLHRLPDLTDHERQLVDEFSHRLVNKLLHDPMLKIKLKSVEGDGELYTGVVSELFNLVVTD